MNIKIIFQALFLCLILNLGLAIGSEANAKRINCERYLENGTEFFRKKSHFDSWFPEELSLNVNDFEEVTGKKYLRRVRKGTTNDGTTNISIKSTLYPDGKLTANSSNLIGQVYARYKCDMTPKEVLQHKTSSAANANSTNSSSNVEKACFDGNVSVCTSEQLCNRATSRRTGVQQWDSLKQFQPYVAEAKSRGLTCGVGDGSTSPSQNQLAIELPETIPSYYDDFRKVTFQFSSGELKTFGAGKVTSTADGFRTDGRVIIRKSLCTANTEFTNNTQEGSFEINCPDGLNIKGGYVPLGTNKGSIGRGYDNKGNAVEYRLHSNTGSNYVSKADFVRFYEAAFSTSKLDKAKATCTELGFTLGTEKHGECVLKMMDN